MPSSSTTTPTRHSLTLMTPSWNGILFSSTATTFATFYQHRYRRSSAGATTPLLSLLKLLSLSRSSIRKGSSIFRLLPMEKVNSFYLCALFIVIFKLLMSLLIELRISSILTKLRKIRVFCFRICIVSSFSCYQMRSSFLFSYFP